MDATLVASRQRGIKWALIIRRSMRWPSRWHADRPRSGRMRPTLRYCIGNRIVALNRDAILGYYVYEAQDAD